MGHNAISVMLRKLYFENSFLMLPSEYFMIFKPWQDIQTCRFTIKDKAITIEGKGENPASSSPLMFVAPDRNYEISAKFEIEDYATAPLLAYAGDNIEIDVNKRGNNVSPCLYGIFYEDINHAGDIGLYGELIKNRSFE